MDSYFGWNSTITYHEWQKILNSWWFPKNTLYHRLKF